MKKALILFESLSGNSVTFVSYIQAELLMKYSDMDIDIISLPLLEEGDIDFSDGVYDYVILGGYTWGNGKIPKITKAFVIENRKWLSKQNLLLFGTGLSVYKHFCRSVDSMKKIIGRNVPSIKFELTFDPEQYEFETKIVSSFIEGEYLKYVN